LSDPDKTDTVFFPLKTLFQGFLFIPECLDYWVRRLFTALVLPKVSGGKNAEIRSSLGRLFGLGGYKEHPAPIRRRNLPGSVE